jgi:hypothetical protein
MRYLSRRRKIGILMIVGAVVPYGVAHWHANRYDWAPLDHRVELRQGAVRSPEFVPQVDGVYVLFLEIEPRRIEMQRQNCLLDVEFFKPERCKSIPHVVDVSWTLWNRRRAVADSSSERTWRASSVSNDGVRREIGRFRARRGERYVLTIDFHRDPGELNVARPKLVAESIQDWDGFALEVQGAFVFGIILAITGFVLLAPFRLPTPSETSR